MILFDPSFLLYPAIGFGSGTIYFFGLWWTVVRLGKAGHPALLALGSFALRAAVVLTVFYLAARGHAIGFLGCLAGFLVARMLITRRLRPEKPAGHGAEKVDGRMPSTMDG